MNAAADTAVRVTVPASTANLGSGFDALGLALSMYDTVEVHPVDGPAGSARVEVTGAGAGSVPDGERHLVVRVIHKVLAELGIPAPALSLTCWNRIPHSRGLGSSAAAMVAGASAALRMVGVDPREDSNAELVLQLVSEWEGHADNAAASLFGGLVIAWNDAGRFHAAQSMVHPDVFPVALVPQEESSTHTTRGLLPEQVPHADAAFAAGRAALAVHAMATDPSLLLAATADRLHQDHREPAWPATTDLVRRLRAAGVPAAVSGAGPTVVAFPAAGALPGGVDLGDFRAEPLPVDGGGVRVGPLG
ncbi:homoserine kinase [Saccharopolyspora sp. HNM0983]|uniref:Homoserine kinase n=1 Tax=Saccharopolyspora montiporae TaxID=2781240 RepID=A0A929BCX8_9PSEU|nr:homoserine kinase [Saccharopolyspora sp. HNM0983]